MLTQEQFITVTEEYPDLFADEDDREWLSFDKLKSFSAEDLSIFFALLEPALGDNVGEDFREAIANHTLTLEEGVELANEMHLLDDEDEKETAFVQKMYMDDGVTFDGIYKDAEGYAKHYTNEYIEFGGFSAIYSHINFKAFGEETLNSVDFQTHEHHGRLFVFRR